MKWRSADNIEELDFGDVDIYQPQPDILDGILEPIEDDYSVNGPEIDAEPGFITHGLSRISEDVSFIVSEANIGDDQLIEVARDCKSQFELFLNNTQEALQYIRTSNIPESNRSTIELGSAETDFRAAFDEECELLGLTEAEKATIETRVDSEVFLITSTTSDMARKAVRKYLLLAQPYMNLNPALLREELVEAAENSLRNLVDDIEALGPRPSDEAAKIEIVKLYLKSRREFTREQQIYDRNAASILRTFKMPSPRDVVKQFVQSAYVQAAKQAFGVSDCPIRYEYGPAGDPAFLLDPTEPERSDGSHSKPRLPIEKARDDVRQATHSALYGQFSPLSLALDQYGDERQKFDRQQRKECPLMVGMHIEANASHSNVGILSFGPDAQTHSIVIDQ